jgi:formylglycine-generating enzyme required for sulfatase activity
LGSEEGHPLQSASVQPERRQLFISYSHRDGEWVERLRRMIKPLEQRYGLERWDDSRIQAGGLWRQEIEQALASASVALLLVSADFLASDFVVRSELPPLFRAAKEKGLRILWVPLRPSLWKHIPEIEQYQAVIPPGRTLAEMAEVEQERAFVQIAELILSTCQEQEVRLARLREEEAERFAREQKEQEVRLAQEQKAEAERLEREQEEEAERVAREREAQERQAEQERLAREAEERPRQEADGLAREQLALERKAEHERLAREQREEQQRQAREQAEHQNRAEVEHWKAEAERLDREMKALERRAPPEQAAEEPPQPAKNDRQEKLQRYEQEFRRAINIQYPLDNYAIDGLKRFQQQLELSDKDVAQIKESLLAKKRAEYVNKPWEQQVSQRQETAKRVPGQAEFRDSEAKEQQQYREVKRATGQPQTSRVRPPSGPLSRRQLLISAGTGLGVVLGVIAVKKQPKPARAISNSTTTLLVRQGDRWEKKAQPILVRNYNEELPQGVDLTMVEISAGSFLMGSPLSEKGRNDYSWLSDDRKRDLGVISSDVEAKRRVSVPAFRMGRFPITQSQWKVVAGLEKVERELNSDPSNFKGPDRPVESVSWHDAIEFCRRLSKHTRRNYTLPSEAQWEYACRAGSTTPFHFGETLTTELANYDGNYTYGQGSKGTYRKQTTDVGSFPANAWGLQDMHGNVWEWCLDRWHPSLAKGPTNGSAWQEPAPELAKEDQDRRLLRGGSWSADPAHCRSAFRLINLPVSRYDRLGFRVCCLPQD